MLFLWRDHTVLLNVISSYLHNRDTLKFAVTVALRLSITAAWFYSCEFTPWIEAIGASQLSESWCTPTISRVFDQLLTVDQLQQCYVSLFSISLVKSLSFCYEWVHDGRREELVVTGTGHSVLEDHTERVKRTCFHYDSTMCSGLVVPPDLVLSLNSKCLLIVELN